MSAARDGANDFRPHPLIANHQIQSILASKSPRRKRWLRRGSRMEALSTAHLLDAGDGVRLTGRHSRQPPEIQPRGLCVLIHGWEGHHDSSYVYSMACQAFAVGWNVFRLNLRDHGGTHALNEALFHSARMDEVLNAIRAVQTFDGSGPLAVIGFSLGGNFALRVGLQGPAAGVVPALSIGISPSIDPGATLRAIDDGPLMFRRYFLSKWRKTLKAKAAAWPGRYDFSVYERLDNFVDTTRQFVSEHTDFASLEDYLEVYTLRPPLLMTSASPLAILTAQDDAVIPIADFAGLEARGSVVAYEAPARGGHCGFIENFALESWAERRVLALLARL
jgi:predicted alpha/beta-fold hydrolase